MSVGHGVSPSKIRAWARANGIPVCDRGRLPNRARQMYEQAHQTLENSDCYSGAGDGDDDDAGAKAGDQSA